MNFKIKNELPLKYHLGIYKHAKAFPQKSDFLFALSTHFIRIAGKKKVKAEDFQVTSDLLKDLFKDVPSFSDFRTFVKQVVPELIQEGKATKNEKGFLLKPKEILNFYDRL